MFGLTVTTPPASEPLTVAEAKHNLRVEHDTEDLLIDSLIVAAREYVEVVTGRALISQTLRLTLDRFPASCIYLPRPPLVSVSSVAYVNGVGSTITLTNNTDYRYDAYSEPGRLEPVTTWPIADERLAAVTITYVAGYADADAVPRTIKQAMHLLIGHWYQNREAVDTAKGSEVPLAVKSLLGVSWSGSMVGSY